MEEVRSGYDKQEADELGKKLNSKPSIEELDKMHISKEGKIESSEKQGCVSIIEFPLGQDENAVGMALSDLFDEGWKFFGLSKTHISISRRWEV